MTSSWNQSWGSSWGHSWGSLFSPMSGSALLQFNQTAALFGSGSLNGSTEIVFQLSGSLRLRTPISGSTNFIFGSNADLGGVANLRGETDLLFVVSQPVLIGFGYIFGESNLLFGTSASLLGPDLPYHLNYTDSTGVIYEEASEDDGFLYYHTYDENPDPIYEEN